MKCPIDQTQLVMSERQGIEIDYCPQCRGVWLDRGELDKLIERSADNRPRPESYDPANRRNDDDDRIGRSSRDEPRPRKREGFLGDLFDF